MITRKYKLEFEQHNDKDWIVTYQCGSTTKIVELNKHWNENYNHITLSDIALLEDFCFTKNIHTSTNKTESFISDNKLFEITITDDRFIDIKKIETQETVKTNMDKIVFGELRNVTKSMFNRLLKENKSRQNDIILKLF